MNAHLVVRGISKRFSAMPVLDGVSFEAARGELLVLVGESGCGKTTLLNIIAGFVRPDAGTIRIDDRPLERTPPDKRDIAMVFQNYALFPHMSIEGNVGFGLEMRGIPRQQRGPKIAAALELTRLEGLAHRYPRELSGGQQQRVAVARALVVEPTVVLLDEPLSNLDAALRKTMREEIREILRAAKTTAIFVTHDLEEALVLGDRIVLLNRGRVEQIGTPRELFEQPKSIETARFFGGTNLLRGTVVQSAGSIAVIETRIGNLRCKGHARQGLDVTIMIRPERIAIGASGENEVRCRVRRSSYLGTINRYEVEAGTTVLVVMAPSDITLEVGQETLVSWKPEDASTLPHADPETAAEPVGAPG